MQQQAATLRLAVFPRLGILADVLLVLAGTGLISGAAQISIKLPFTPVPITGQTFAVVLVGAALGSFRGVSSAGLYVLLGLVAPVYASGSEGWSQLTGASGGYLWGMVLAAGLTGYLAEQGWSKKFSGSLSAMLSGNVVIYLCGLPWLAHELHTNLNKTLEYGLYPFVPGDMVKLYLAGATLPVAWRLVERVSGRK